MALLVFCQQSNCGLSDGSLQKYCPYVTKHEFPVYGDFLFVGSPQYPTLKVFFFNCKIKKSAVCWTYRLFWKSSNYSKKASTIIFLVACKDIWNASKCQSGAAAPFEICKKKVTKCRALTSRKRDKTPPTLFEILKIEDLEWNVRNEYTKMKYREDQEV